jgi:F-type H+-transporting ATPase subunit alpha
VDDVSRFETELLDFIGRSRGEIYTTIRETGDLSDDAAVKLKDAVDEFRRGFQTGSGELLVNDEPAEPLEESEVQQEKLRKRVDPPQDKKK